MRYQRRPLRGSPPARSRCAALALALMVVAEPTFTGCAVTNHYLVSEELPPAPSGQEGRRITVRGYTQCPDATFNSFRGDMIAVGADSLRLEPEKAASTSGEAAYLSRAEVPTVSIRKISGSRTAWLVYGLVSVAFSIAVAATWESPTGL